jgi:hypothetical protein
VAVDIRRRLRGPCRWRARSSSEDLIRRRQPIRPVVLVGKREVTGGSCGWCWFTKVEKNDKVGPTAATWRMTELGDAIDAIPRGDRECFLFQNYTCTYHDREYIIQILLSN